MVTDLLIKLINAESTKDTGELESANVLADFFRKHGIHNQIDVWENTRANIFARINGNGQKKGLLFASHIDVVPAGEEKWESPPFEATEVDDKIFGRGACDMKAGNAAIAVAAAEILTTGVELKGDLLIAATAGEETDSCGALKFIEDYKDELGNLQGIILPEPTNFEIINGHRGIFWIKIITHGKTAHGSMPQLGVNAIDSMSQILNHLQDYKPKCVAHPNFGTSTFSVNTITGGKATNVIPDQCVIEIDIRTIPNQDKRQIITDLENIFKNIKSNNSNSNAEIVVERDVDSMFTEPECEFVKKLCKFSKIENTKIVGYTTDGPIFEKLNVPVVVWGPGKTELAHQPDEYIDIKDLRKAVELYKGIILDFLG